MITKKDYESLIQLSLDHPDGTSYQPVETLPDGRQLCLVIGWQVGYDEGEDYQLKVGNTLYTLCEKLAVKAKEIKEAFEKGELEVE